MAETTPGRRPPPHVPTGAPPRVIDRQGNPIDVTPIWGPLIKLWNHVYHAHTGMPATHGATHNVGGSDPLSTPGAPSQIIANVAGAAGVGPAPAREDHVHEVSIGAPVSLGMANSIGSGGALALANHVHATPLTTNGDLLTVLGGVLARRGVGAHANGEVLTLVAGLPDWAVPPASAPVDAEYLVAAAHAGLSAERVATATATVTWDFTVAAQAKANVPDDAITYAKMQNISAASRVLGRGSAAGAGDTEEISLGTSLSMAATVLNTIQGIRTTDEPTFAGLTLVNEEFNTQATTPAQITANQANYNPGNGCFFRLDSDADRVINGITGGVDGRRIIFRNIGAFKISLAHQNALGTSAENRIICPNARTLIMVPDSLVELIYDSTTQRWVAALITNRITVDLADNIHLYVGSAELNTTATTGFPCIPTCNGVPTGAPAAVANMAQVVYDRANQVLYIFSGGAWNAH